MPAGDLGQLPACSGDRKPKQVFQGGIGPDVLITTEAGPIPARQITKGMRVLTQAQGYRPVLWAGLERRLHSGAGRPVPIMLRGGALNGQVRAKTTVLAPGQNVLLRHQMNELFFAAPTVLCAAQDLGDLPRVERMHGQHAAHWVHLMFDDLALVDAGGLWLESLAPNMHALRKRYPQMAAGIEIAAPSLRYEHGQAAFARSHSVLNRKESRMLDPAGYLT